MIHYTHSILFKVQIVLQLLLLFVFILVDVTLTQQALICGILLATNSA